MKKLLLSLLVGILLVAGCTQSSGNPPGSNGSGTSAGQNAVKISNFAFVPQSIAIKAGESVTWTNEDSVQHQIAADPGQPDIVNLSSPSMNNGATYSYTFSKAGTWTYHCSIHPSMKGTVVVG